MKFSDFSLCHEIFSECLQNDKHVFSEPVTLNGN